MTAYVGTATSIAINPPRLPAAKITVIIVSG